MSTMFQLKQVLPVTREVSQGRKRFFGFSLFLAFLGSLTLFTQSLHAQEKELLSFNFTRVEPNLDNVAKYFFSPKYASCTKLKQSQWKDCFNNTAAGILKVKREDIFLSLQLPEKETQAEAKEKHLNSIEKYLSTLDIFSRGLDKKEKKAVLAVLENISTYIENTHGIKIGKNGLEQPENGEKNPRAFYLYLWQYTYQVVTTSFPGLVNKAQKLEKMYQEYVNRTSQPVSLMMLLQYVYLVDGKPKFVGGGLDKANAILEKWIQSQPKGWETQLTPVEMKIYQAFRNVLDIKLTKVKKDFSDYIPLSYLEYRYKEQLR